MGRHSGVHIYIFIYIGVGIGLPKAEVKNLASALSRRSQRLAWIPSNLREDATFLYRRGHCFEFDSIGDSADIVGYEKGCHPQAGTFF